MNESTDPALSRALRAIADGRPLDEEMAAAAFRALMSGSASPVHAAGLLIGLRARGETAEELAGAARALRSTMRTVTLPEGRPAIDTCGTGGGTVTTFNVSTAAALVASAAGAVVAKHGNRSYTSRCGSADVLESLGVAITTTPEQAARLLADVGMAFLFAPAFHPAMRHVAATRRELGVPTIMNLVGPLANPAGVTRQVIGVADRDRGPLVADALARLSAAHALVVHAVVGMDEVAPSGETLVWEVQGGEVRPWRIRPADHDLEVDDMAGLAGGGPAENADRLRCLLDAPGEDAVGRAAVLLNAGAGLYVAGVCANFALGVERAAAALDEGLAAARLDLLIASSR